VLLELDLWLGRCAQSLGVWLHTETLNMLFRMNEVGLCPFYRKKICNKLDKCVRVLSFYPQHLPTPSQVISPEPNKHNAEKQQRKSMHELGSC
jgi:hypothetical protein